MACPNCFRPPRAVSDLAASAKTLGCVVNGDHGGKVDDYYCTDGGIVTLCALHLRNAAVVVWDTDAKPPIPITKKYYDEVYSKK